MRRYEEGEAVVHPSGEVVQPLVMIAPRLEKTGKGEKYEACAVCGFYFPLSKLTKSAGKYYCSHYGCVNDIRGRR